MDPDTALPPFAISNTQSGGVLWHMALEKAYVDVGYFLVTTGSIPAG